MSNVDVLSQRSIKVQHDKPNRRVDRTLDYLSRQINTLEETASTAAIAKDPTRAAKVQRDIGILIKRREALISGSPEGKPKIKPGDFMDLYKKAADDGLSTDEIKLLNGLAGVKDSFEKLGK